MTDLLADELMEELNGVRRVVRRRLRVNLTGPALAGSQVELLKVVEATPDIGVAAAAAAMRLAGNSVSALVYQLVDANFLARETDPGDRRAARLRLTAAGADRLATWRAERARLVGTALAQISTADRQSIATALPALRRLTEVLADAGLDARHG
jgi:DNA-binding MarR family transcriptional regulator